jgi:uncharacterized protein
MEKIDHGRPKGHHSRVASGEVGMIRFASAMVLLIGSAAWAVAATPHCQRNDAEAEQAIRFQTQLMVVSDTCGAQTYTAFAQRNREALLYYQHKVIERFRRSGGSHAEARFDAYLTRLANEESLRLGAQPVSTVCRDAQNLLAVADTLSGESFRHYVAEQAAQHADMRCPD